MVFKKKTVSIIFVEKKSDEKNYVLKKNQQNLISSIVFEKYFSRPKAGFQRVSPRWDFPSVSDNNNHENHSAPMQKAADLEVPGEF